MNNALANPVFNLPVVSHDRAFLNEVATGMFEVDSNLLLNQLLNIFFPQTSYINTLRG